MRWGLLSCLALDGFVAALAAAGSEADGDAATCAATGKGCAAAPPAGGSPHYPWPSARGRHENPSRSPFKGPKNLTESLAWVWRHPEGQYRVIIPSGPLIDDKGNIYISTTEQIWSFDSSGNTRWVHTAAARIGDTSSLWDGKLYFMTGYAVLGALDLETGVKRLEVRIAEMAGGDIASVAAYEGRVFASTGGTQHGGSSTVTCVNASDGSKLWDVKPDTGLWNFLPMFPGDGTVVFQTENGDPYSVRISDGEVLWKHHREGFGWTDGGTIIGPNGVAYVVHAEGHIAEDALRPDQKSDITAYRLSDGKQLWRHAYSTPPNSWPVVAPMGESKRQTVLFPYGGQSFQNPIMQAFDRLSPIFGVRAFGYLNDLYLMLGRYGKYVFRFLFRLDLRFPWPGGVTAFEPSTGKVLWEWAAPDWWMPEVKGDDTGLLDRVTFAHRDGKLYGQMVCIPNPWGSPTVSSDGTMYLGFQDGVIYALQEQGGKGVVVDTFETSAGFSHPGVAMGPGMMVVANCDSMYVFKYKES